MLENYPSIESSRLLELTTAVSTRFNVSQANEATESKSELAGMIFQAVVAVDSFLRVGRNLAFAILSAEETIGYTLKSDEAKLLSPRACQRKREEFTLGRTAARLALERLGIQKSPSILRCQDGEPLWPAGVAGSITHCYPWTIAVVAKGTERFTIGIDLEDVQRIKEIDISKLICTENELDWVYVGADFRKRLAIIFSVKEAIYKAFYPLCHRYIDFKEVTLSPLTQPDCFRADFSTALDYELSPADSCEIRYKCRNDYVFSYVVHAGY